MSQSYRTNTDGPVELFVMTEFDCFSRFIIFIISFLFSGLPCDPPASPSRSRWVREVNSRQADENSSRGNAILGGRKETEARRDQDQRQGVYHHHPQRHAHRRPASAVCRSGERSAEGLLALRVFATRLRVPAAVLGVHLRPLEGCWCPGFNLMQTSFKDTAKKLDH